MAHVAILCTRIFSLNLAALGYPELKLNKIDIGTFYFRTTEFVLLIVSERLNESLYRVNHNGETGAMNSDSKRLDQNTDSKKSSHPVDSIEYSGQSGFLGGPHLRFSERHSKRIVASPFSGQSIYVDNDVSSDLCSKVGLNFFEGSEVISLLS